MFRHVLTCYNNIIVSSSCVKIHVEVKRIRKLCSNKEKRKQKETKLVQNGIFLMTVTDGPCRLVVYCIQPDQHVSDIFIQRNVFTLCTSRLVITPRNKIHFIDDFWMAKEGKTKFCDISVYGTTTRTCKLTHRDFIDTQNVFSSLSEILTIMIPSV